MKYADMTTQQFYATCGDNAEKWAEAFQEIVVNRGVKIDEGLMMGWFANAIETAHDKRTGSGPVILPDGSAFFSATV